MSTKARRHVHKYHRINLGASKVWACALPDCNHYMPVHMQEAVPGKASICWNCDEKFEMETDLMKIDRPICRDCRSEELIKYLESKEAVNK